MKSTLTEAEYTQQWKAAGISDASIKKIAPLVRTRELLRLVPDPDARLWSRWGGTPSFESPVDMPEDRFILQIAISELPEGQVKDQFPEEGALYFFVHKKGRDKGLVLHQPTAPGLPENDPSPEEGLELRKTQHQLHHPTTSIRFEISSSILFPEYESDEFDELDLPPEDGNAYMDWEEEWLEGGGAPYEGCRLLGGWTDIALTAGGSYSRKNQDTSQVLLALNPTENKTISNSALGGIPFLTQRLFFYIDSNDLKNKHYGNVVCRYGHS